MEKLEIIAHLKGLRDKIKSAFESFEPACRFEKTTWDHVSGGGGEISLLRGDIFEKAAVNFSAVSGDKFPLDSAEGPFFATGISLITHMQNPHAPTVHMNIRYIETKDRFWLGGGYDLTPMGFFYPEDKEHFHAIAKKAAGAYYPEFSENAKKYFYIPHRDKERGLGGLFFDYFNTGNKKADLALWKNIGDTFLEAILPILDKRISLPYSAEDKKLQKKMRGHYVEFNLLYDRGTKFGFQSGGNPEAILCSLPPDVSW